MNLQYVYIVGVFQIPVDPISEVECMRPDVRLEQEQQASCTDYQVATYANITSALLFPTGS